MILCNKEYLNKKNKTIEDVAIFKLERTKKEMKRKERNDKNRIEMRTLVKVKEKKERKAKRK